MGKAVQGGAGTAAGQPVAVAALVRTSTLDLQDPVASYRRQVRTMTGWLPSGWYITAIYADVESGGTDLDHRSETGSWKVLTDAGLQRDGGMADLLAEAAAPDPAFSVVVVEDIERASRDFYDSVTLERRLADQGIPLLATDEPADITGLNATTVLVRRIKQGVAEWYRIQLKAKTRKGLEEHAIAGYNNGRVPWGYTPDRVLHAVPVKAAQGRTRTRLAADPLNGPWVTQIFEWRVLESLSREAICGRLEAAGVPAPGGTGGWGPNTVGKILANPKYTGHMVYGRTRNTGKSQRPGQRKIRATPMEEWTWSKEPSHPALVSRDMWEAAQKVGKDHAGVRDTEVPTTQPGRRYALRSRLHCAQCGRRMNGTTRPGRKPGQCYTYYVCPWRASNPRDLHRCPDHVRAAMSEEIITTAIGGFLDAYVFGHDRDAMLAVHLPATAAGEAARREAQAAELGRQVARNQASAKGLITELSQLGDDTSPAAAEYRKRIREHHADLWNATAALQSRLDEITAQAAEGSDAALITELPYAVGILNQAPDEVREALYAALDIHATYRADKNQVTIRATITDTTPGIVTALLADPRTGGDSPGKAPAPHDDMSTADTPGAGSPSRIPVLFGESNTVAITTWLPQPRHHAPVGALDNSKKRVASPSPKPGYGITARSGPPRGAGDARADLAYHHARAGTRTRTRTGTTTRSRTTVKAPR
jgi:site-specific DNA recombinase